MKPKQPEIWVVDDDPSLRWVMREALEQASYTARDFSSAHDVLPALKQTTPDALITDIHLPGEDGLKLLQELRASHPGIPVIVITAHSDLESAVAAYQGGAFEYLPKPFDVDELIAV
ncbi:MAG: response regulator, partial [Gammaproteobacteria bacterium]